MRAIAQRNGAGNARIACSTASHGPLSDIASLFAITAALSRKAIQAARRASWAAGAGGGRSVDSGGAAGTVGGS